MHLSRSESIKLVSGYVTNGSRLPVPAVVPFMCLFLKGLHIGRDQKLRPLSWILKNASLAGMSSPKLRGVAVCIVCVAGRIFVSKSHPAQHHHPALPRQPGGCLCCCCCCFGTIQEWILLPAGILCSCSRNQRYVLKKSRVICHPAKQKHSNIMSSLPHLPFLILFASCLLLRSTTSNVN